MNQNDKMTSKEIMSWIQAGLVFIIVFLNIALFVYQSSNYANDVRIFFAIIGLIVSLWFTVLFMHFWKDKLE